MTLFSLFAMAMGIHDHHHQNDQADDKEDYDRGFMLPDIADKIAEVLAHALTYTIRLQIKVTK